VTVSAALIHTGDWTPESGYQAVQRWFKAKVRFTALFAQNDPMAIGAIQAARQHGQNVPEQLAVIGFDDIPLAAYFDPPLTTIRQNIFEHGCQAARLLVKRVEQPGVMIEHVAMPCELVVRQSSGGRRADSMGKEGMPAK
jgi:DNA-binding LacI/PurR family transcriptional regulator